MELTDAFRDEYNIPSSEKLSAEKLKVIVELDNNDLRISCEGPCDVKKWKTAYVAYWRRKMRNQKVIQENI